MIFIVIISISFLMIDFLHFRLRFTSLSFLSSSIFFAISHYYFFLVSLHFLFDFSLSSPSSSFSLMLIFAFSFLSSSLIDWLLFIGWWCFRCFSLLPLAIIAIDIDITSFSVIDWLMDFFMPLRLLPLLRCRLPCWLRFRCWYYAALAANILIVYWLLMPLHYHYWYFFADIDTTGFSFFFLSYFITPLLSRCLIATSLFIGWCFLSLLFADIDVSFIDTLIFSIDRLFFFADYFSSSIQRRRPALMSLFHFIAMLLRLRWLRYFAADCRLLFHRFSFFFVIIFADAARYWCHWLFHCWCFFFLSFIYAFAMLFRFIALMFSPLLSLFMLWLLAFAISLIIIMPLLISSFLFLRYYFDTLFFARIISYYYIFFSSSSLLSLIISSLLLIHIAITPLTLMLDICSMPFDAFFSPLITPPPITLSLFSPWFSSRLSDCADIIAFRCFSAFFRRFIFEASLFTLSWLLFTFAFDFHCWCHYATDIIFTPLPFSPLIFRVYLSSLAATCHWFSRHGLSFAIEADYYWLIHYFIRYCRYWYWWFRFIAAFRYFRLSLPYWLSFIDIDYFSLSSLFSSIIFTLRYLLFFSLSIYYFTMPPLLFWYVLMFLSSLFIYCFRYFSIFSLLLLLRHFSLSFRLRLLPSSSSLISLFIFRRFFSFSHYRFSFSYYYCFHYYCFSLAITYVTFFDFFSPLFSPLRHFWCLCCHAHYWCFISSFSNTDYYCFIRRHHYFLLFISSFSSSAFLLITSLG